MNPLSLEAAILSRRALLMSSLAVALPFDAFGFTDNGSNKPVCLGGDETPPTLTESFLGRIPMDPYKMAMRADTLARQIKRECSYFGYPRDYTPPRSPMFFEGNLDELLGSATVIDTEAQPIIDAKDAKESQLKKMQSLAGLLDRTLNDLVEKREANLADIHTLGSTILALRTQVDNQRIVVQAIEAADQLRLGKDGSGCNLPSILSIAVAIVAVVGAAFTAGESLGVLVEDIGDVALSIGTIEGVGQVVADLELLVTDYLAAKADYDDLAAKFKDLKGLLDGDPSKGRIVILNAEVDGLKSRFFADVDGSALPVDSKTELKREGGKYFDLSLALNAKILERDGLVLQVRAIELAVVEQRLARDHVRDDLAKKANPDQAAYADFLARMKAASMDSLRFLVWLEKRALAYYELADPVTFLQGGRKGLTISGTRLVDLRASQQALREERTRYDVTQLNHPVPFSPVTYEFNISTGTASSLARDRIFAFSISPHGPAFEDFMTAILATQVSIYFPDAPIFKGTLEHTGTHRFLLKGGKSVQYSSQPLINGIETTASVAILKFTEGSADLSGVSPFTTWVLRAEKAMDPALLAKIGSVRLTFEGTYIAITS